MKTLLVLACLVTLSGCASYRLPAITAESMTYKRSEPFGGTEVKASGVKVTDSKVTANTASWVTIYPSFSVSVSVEGYERKLKKGEKPQTTNE